MIKKNLNKEGDNVTATEQKEIKSLIDSIEEDTASGAKYKRWEADAARSALFEQEEKRPVLSVVGLIMGLLCWILLFILPSGEENIIKQIFLMMALSVGSLLLSFFGRKQAYAMSVIGMLVSGGLLLFLIIALIAFYVTK